MNRIQTTLAAGAAVVITFISVVALRTDPERLLPPSGTATYAPHPGPARIPAGLTLPPDPTEPLICTSTYKAVCQKRGVTRDPTGSVIPDVNGEILVLRTYEEIIRAHPDWTVEQVDAELGVQVYTERRRDRLLSAYNWVKRAVGEFIDRQPESTFTHAEKKQLRGLLRQVELQLPPPVSLYADEPDLITRNDVFYERLADGSTRLRVGGAYVVTAKSWFNAVFTLAHEIGHVIDPCEIRSRGFAFPAYDRLSACFLSQGTVASRKNRSECGLHDQLSETFADWIAVQISAEALAYRATPYTTAERTAAAINSVRDLCDHEEDPGEADTDYHPSPEIRIDRIFGRNLRIREFLSCGPRAGDAPACDFDFQP